MYDSVSVIRWEGRAELPGWGSKWSVVCLLGVRRSIDWWISLIGLVAHEPQLRAIAAGGLHRTAAVDLPGPAPAALRSEATEENEAARGPAAGAVSRGGEREPPRGDAGSAESLLRSVKGK